MGPRWTLPELEIFLKNFQQNQLEKVDQIQEELELAGYIRTRQNILSLYQKNKNFLTKNKSCSQHDLEAILDDYYDSIESNQLFLSQLALQNNQPETKQNKFIKNYYQQDSQNDLEQFDSERKAKKHYKKIINQKKPLTDLKQEHYYSSIELASDIDESSQYQTKNKKFLKYEKILPFTQHFMKNGRKALPPSSKPLLFADLPQEGIFFQIEELVKTCQGKSQRQQQQLDGTLFSYESQKFIENEYFYSHLDKAYFEQNEFRQILDNLEISYKKGFTSNEWKFLRKVIGKPRRFSQFFVRKEKQKLDIYRKIVRSYLNDNVRFYYNKLLQSYPIEKYIKNATLVSQIQIITPFSVGQVCQAIHPVCKHFHKGSVLTTNNSQVILKFFTNELGVHKINQNQLTVDLVESNKQIRFQQQQPIQYFNNDQNTGKFDFSHNKNYNKFQERSLNNNSNLANLFAVGSESGSQENNNITQDLDFIAMAFFIKILERKNALINELRSFNNKAETNSNQIDEIYFQEYGWSGVHISLLDNALKHICAKFRLRGVNNSSLIIIIQFDYCLLKDVCQIQENFDKILLHPLKQFISNDKSNQFELDRNVLKELTQIINKTDEVVWVYFNVFLKRNKYNKK